MKNTNIKMPPWCVFCGQKVGRPQPPVRRKLQEFTVGTCQCGAIYTCDPTGFNIGSAMIEALVYACNDNWDLAWELLPDDDYLTGRIERYDEQTHQVIETGNLDGRFIRGVLYFVRLHKDIAEIKERVSQHQEESGTKSNRPPGFSAPPVEPTRDPKRNRQRASKPMVKQLVETRDIDGLVDLLFDDIRVLRFLQRLLYDPVEESRWLTAYMTGQACARLATRQPGHVSDLLHRLFESCADSASTNWGLIETIGSVIASRPDIFGAFTRHLLPYSSHESTRVLTMWAFAEIARHRPDLIRAMPFYKLLDYLDSEDADLIGNTLRLCARIKAIEKQSVIESLRNDKREARFYENGSQVTTTLGQLAEEALASIATSKEKTTP
ncbi:MAG: PBS lyase [Desulfobulbaceae bacterium]|nr:PBS lyase [Desulfobulbaceae bacterium]